MDTCGHPEQQDDCVTPHRLWARLLVTVLTKDADLWQEGGKEGQPFWTPRPRSSRHFITFYLRKRVSVLLNVKILFNDTCLKIQNKTKFVLCVWKYANVHLKVKIHDFFSSQSHKSQRPAADTRSCLSLSQLLWKWKKKKPISRCINCQKVLKIMETCTSFSLNR